MPIYAYRLVHSPRIFTIPGHTILTIIYVNNILKTVTQFI